MEITIPTKRALELVEAHREAHIKEYDLQMEGYQIAMRDWGEANLAWSRDENRSGDDRPKEPAKPPSFVESYDRLLAELREHSGDGLNIFDSDIEEIVHDKFPWTGHFVTNASTYGSTSAYFSTSA